MAALIQSFPRGHQYGLLLPLPVVAVLLLALALLVAPALSLTLALPLALLRPGHSSPALRRVPLGALLLMLRLLLPRLLLRLLWVLLLLRPGLLLRLYCLHRRPGLNARTGLLIGSPARRRLLPALIR